MRHAGFAKKMIFPVAGQRLTGDAYAEEWNRRCVPGLKKKKAAAEREAEEWIAAVKSRKAAK